jgi:hypothetical protein
MKGAFTNAPNTVYSRTRSSSLLLRLSPSA